MCLAIPGKVVELLSEQQQHAAMIDVLGVRRRVDLALLQDDYPKLGDWVLIHVGFAMSKISEPEALDQLRMLTALGEQDAALEEVNGYDFGDSPPDNTRAGP
jgi:hydrogenase expression/formation protein HypC